MAEPQSIHSMAIIEYSVAVRRDDLRAFYLHAKGCRNKELKEV